MLPRRRFVKGTRPGVTGSGPLGGDCRDDEQWQRLSGWGWKQTHIYTFGGRFYKQKDGGPIGLRSMMSRWDMKCRARLEENNLSTEDDVRYMDDSRALMYPIRAGWK